MKKIILLLVTTTLCLVGVNAQDILTTEEMNSVYKKEKHHTKRVQEYVPLREADMMWYKDSLLPRRLLYERGSCPRDELGV